MSLSQSSLALVLGEEESIAVNRTVVNDPLLFTTTASRRRSYPFWARGASFFLTSPFPHSEASFCPAVFTLTTVIYASPPFYLFPYQQRAKRISALVFPKLPFLRMSYCAVSVPLPEVPAPFRAPTVSPTHPRVPLPCDISP